MQEQQQRLPKHDRILLDAMLLSEGRGSYETLQDFISRSGHHLKASADSDVVTEYEKLLSRAAEAFDYERLNGVGSLFKLEHPLNQRYLSTWLKLPPHYIEAIEREAKKKSAHDAAA